MEEIFGSNPPAQLTKTEAEALIDRLASKELTFGCAFLGASGSYHRLDGIYIHEKGELYSDSRNPHRLVQMHKILGHPILIGDVLEKMQFIKEYVALRDIGHFIELWLSCRTDDEYLRRKTGLSKSLQKIYAEAEWEEVCSECGMVWLPASHKNLNCGGKDVLIPKQPHIRDLFQFLLQLEL